jgi:enediyne biosynthesis protein E4
MVFKCARIFVYVMIALVSFSCSKKDEQKKLFEMIPSDHSGISFFNKVENTQDFNLFSYRNFFNGGGVAIGDINNDGLPDVYMTSNMGSNKLYLNKGNFKFEDISTTAGVEGSKAWSTGVVMADINADGLLDIYVCNAGYIKGDNRENELFINNGNLTFTEKAAAYNLNENGYTTHAAFFDYDLDGDLDAYILNNSFIPVNTLNFSNRRDLYAKDWPVKDFIKGGGDKLLRNDSGVFTDVTEKAGVYGSLIGFGLGITVGDINGDRYPDMYISNDFYERDYLYINQKDGTFKEDIENCMEHVSLQSMGADMTDINNDGYPEIFVTDMLPDDDYRLKTTSLFDDYKIYNLKLERDFYHQYMQNTLQLNNKNNTFSEIAWYSGVAATDWSWGALMFDADNDGYKDIYVCNGVYQDETNQDFINFFANDVVQKMALTGKKEEMEKIIAEMPSNPLVNKLYHNNKDLTFADAGTAWGIDQTSFSNGSAYGDLDNDGDLDLVINNINQEAFLYRNNSNELLHNHYLKVSLKGTEKNTYAVGSKVTAYVGKENINVELIPTRGFQSSIDYTIVLGLGKALSIDSLVVSWPDMTRSVFNNVSVDTTLSIDYSRAIKTMERKIDINVLNDKTLFQEVTSSFEAHHEDDFVDFYEEGLLIKMLSREGPKAATGDVNLDGLEDIFIGGAAGQSGALYFQTGKGEFIKSKNYFKRMPECEDTAAAFFDLDGDGDLDLVVGSGGNHFQAGVMQMQNRIYLNDGQGNFSEREMILPNSGMNTSVIIPFDLEHDGDTDLFVGTRSIPKVYGVSPSSYIYRNEGKGRFVDVTTIYAPALKSIGMITNAKFIDVSGDKEPELVLTGEWMSPVILQMTSGKYEKVSSNLDNYKGWWYTVDSDDVDGDGDQDLILGNRGENFFFSGSPEAPAKLWVNDFDNNGTVEKIVTRSINGRDMPVALKKELTDQIVSLKKKNLKHAEYARKSVQELFSPETIKATRVLEANWFKSSIAINQGNGNFEVKALPKEVQFSCVSAICFQDLNHDGKKDLMLGGNFTGFMPQYAKLDASFGHTLINTGNGNFELIDNTKSGFFIRGDARQMVPLTIDKKPNVLVTLNNQKPKLFVVKN